MNRTRLFDMSETRIAAIAPQVIRNLTALTQGIESNVGARMTSTSDAVACLKYLDTESKGILILPDGSLGPVKKGKDSVVSFRTVWAIGSDEGIYETRRKLERAHRQGDSTCLIVGSTTPTANVIRQLHLSHEYVLVDWQPEHDERSTRGIVKTAWENASTVIADQVRDVDQARRILLQGVTLGIMRRDFDWPPS